MQLSTRPGAILPYRSGRLDPKPRRPAVGIPGGSPDRAAPHGLHVWRHDADAPRVEHRGQALIGLVGKRTCAAQPAAACPTAIARMSPVPSASRSTSIQAKSRCSESGSHERPRPPDRFRLPMRVMARLDTLAQPLLSSLVCYSAGSKGPTPQPRRGLSSRWPATSSSGPQRQPQGAGPRRQRIEADASRSPRASTRSRLAQKPRHLASRARCRAPRDAALGRWGRSAHMATGGASTGVPCATHP
jgi:hypothetical protein